MDKFIKQIIEEKVASKKKKKTQKKKKEVDEVVDEKGNFIKGKKPTDLNAKTTTSNSTSDEVAKTGAGSMGDEHGIYGTSHRARRYWGESDMSAALGYEDTLGQDAGYEQAKKHFEDNLELDDEETKERLAQMGYDEKLPDNVVRLVENPLKFVEEYLESVLSKRTNSNDIIDQEIEEKEVNPIILKQIKSLKNSLSSNNLTVKDILKHLKDNE